MPRARTLRASADSVLAWFSGLHVLRQDALLYLVAGVFAGLTSLVAVTDDYREWGLVAVGPYLVAALACEWVVRRRERAGITGLEGEGRASRFRRVVVLLLLLGVVLIPLALQVTFRADAAGCVTNHRAAQAQPEVSVIERAGDRVASFHDPYLAHPKTVGVSPSNDCRSVNANTFFPYLPGMVIFGVANAAHLPRELGDARVWLAGSTILLVLMSLLLVDSTTRRRWRAFQFLVVLPTGALPMVTGGDDLPVLALLLLGLVLAQRRRPVLAGLVMGLAGTLKWTAWPLILLAILCVRDEDDRPATLRYSLSVLLVALPVIGAGLALGAHAFVENVVLFPLGLTSVRSPAASPLPGQVLVQLLPHYKRVLTVCLVGGGAAVVLGFLLKHPPRSAYAAAWFAGWALAFATLIAPATRFGYLIYPANMFVWAYLLHYHLAERRREEPLLEPPVSPAAQLSSPS